MSVVYSHSKLETFEQCNLKFKYRYVDKIIPKIPKSIEAHLGNIVHKTLEWLYSQVLEKKPIPSIGEIIAFYSDEWTAEYDAETEITDKNMGEEDYFTKGVEFILNYYMKHQPFNDNTIAIEKRIELDLDENKEKKLIGYIDRLVDNIESNEIEIHDYKTSSSLSAIKKIENSRQLALYSLAVKELFGKEKNVCIVWHFLAHDAKVCVRKTNEELESMRKEVIALIDEIEETKEFVPTISPLCNWCEYRDICEAWNKVPKGEEQKRLF